MKYILLVLGLAVCAHAEAPNYLGAYSNNLAASNALLKHMNFDKKNPAAVNYIVLNLAVDLLAEAVNEKQDYDKVYLTMIHNALAIGPVLPNRVKEITLARHKTALKWTKPIRELVEELCFVPSQPELRVVQSTKCNEDVDKVVHGAFNFPIPLQALLLLDLGDLSKLYLDLEPELNAAAEKNIVFKYLKSGKDRLRPFVFQAAKVYDSLRAFHAVE